MSEANKIGVLQLGDSLGRGHVAVVAMPTPPFRIDDQDVDSEGYVVSERLQKWLSSAGYGYLVRDPK